MTVKETVYFRIAAHTAAVARLDAACDPADDIAAKQRGEVVTPEAIAERDAADRAELSAFEELLAYVPINTVEHCRKVEYLQFALRCREPLDRDEMSVLLHSLRQYRPRAA